MARPSSQVLRQLCLSFAFAFLLPLSAGCGEASSTDAVAALRFDPCTPVAVVLDPGATDDELAGARAAIAWWNAAAGAQLVVVGASDPPEAHASLLTSLPLHFEVAAAPSHGLYDEARGEVFVNVDLGGHPLAVTIAHELGHAFGLVHVDDRASVMRAGNLDVEPGADDVAALARAWGVCATRTAMSLDATLMTRSHTAPPTRG